MGPAAPPDLRSHAYIVGRISGMPEGNRLQFVAAAKELREIGWHTHIPHDMPSAQEALMEAERLGRGAVGQPAYQRVMKDLLHHMLDRPMDAVFVLPQWWASVGAQTEVIVASQVGIPIFTLDGHRVLVDVPSSIVVHWKYAAGD